MGSGSSQPQRRRDGLADRTNYPEIWRTRKRRQAHGSVGMWAAHAGNWGR